MRIVFTPRATRELLEAAQWWRTHRLEAPRLLDDEVDQALRRIAVYPRSGTQVQDRDARRVVLRRSGYLLWHPKGTGSPGGSLAYRLRPRLERIEVISVSHGRRAGR